MSGATYYIGDVFDVMATLPDDSVDLVLTSPPFLALRSYLPADHPDKAKEIGSEPTPAEFLDTLLELTAEWGRLLGPYGSICVELGDTYAGNNGTSADDVVPTNPGRSVRYHWPLDKSLTMMPSLYAACLAYGRNLLTGEPSPAGQWRVRNVVAWCRPNPPVGALGDKFRPATSYMTIATRARDRWFDLDAVRQPQDPDRRNRSDAGGGTSPGLGSGKGDGSLNPAGAPPLDWWEVSTEPYKGSHYATWPRKLLDRPIRAMCPQQVCTTCGEPRRRITQAAEGYADKLGGSIAGRHGKAADSGLLGSTQPPGDHIVAAQYETVGWTDCGHDSWRNGIVLDPFAGSGTTLAVATGHGRDAIGIDLDERNADLARDRIGMFLEVVDTRQGAA